MKTSILASIALAIALVATSSQAQSAAPVKNFDVFVDPPTGFVFVKLPAGWKFVGKLEPSEVKSLPDTVITSLLAPEPDDPRMAQGAQAPRP